MYSTLNPASRPDFNFQAYLLWQKDFNYWSQASINDDDGDSDTAKNVEYLLHQMQDHHLTAW